MCAASQCQAESASLNYVLLLGDKYAVHPTLMSLSNARVLSKPSTKVIPYDTYHVHESPMRTWCFTKVPCVSSF